MVYALVTAGGRGRRFGGPVPKQYADLAGVPVVVRTLRAFDACPAVDRLVLVVPAGDEPWVRQSLIARAGLAKPLGIAAGGVSRQESVFAGLCAIGEEDGLVAIHDAVRPLVTLRCIEACIAAARETGAAIAAVPLRDTLKKTGPGAAAIAATIAREGLWLAQTPQVFRLGLIRAAHEEARRLGLTATDDAALVERRGATVRIVEGSPFNFKITTVADLELAAAVLGRGLPPPGGGRKGEHA